MRRTLSRRARSRTRFRTIRSSHGRTGRDGSNRVDLTPLDGVKCDVIDDLEDEPDEILFQMNRRNPEVFDAWRMDVRSGEMRLVAENPGNVQGWITDHDGRLRARREICRGLTALFHPVLLADPTTDGRLEP